MPQSLQAYLVCSISSDALVGYVAEVQLMYRLRVGSTGELIFTLKQGSVVIVVKI